MKKTTKICLTALAGSCALVAAISLAACGNDNKTEAESHTHAYGEWSIVTPTKTTEGSAEKVCPDCGETEEGHKITVVLPQLTDGRYTVTGDTATCEAAGVATYGITLDGYEIEFSAATDATGHKLGDKVDAADATCTQRGNVAYYQCEKCQKYFSDQDAQEPLEENNVFSAKLEHNYQLHEKEDATCEHAGKAKHYTCSTCDTVFNENKEECEESELVIKQKDHNYGLENEALEATCTTDGNIAWCECLVCHKYFRWDDKTEIQKSEITIQKTGHNIGEKVELKEPTCDQPGNPEYYQCSNCNCYFSDAQGEHQLDSIVTPAKGHSFLCTDLPEPNPEGGKLSMTCQNGCGTTRDVDYNGTLDCGTTSINAPAEITGNGTYYIKATTANVFIKIPIAKAGTYRVDFTNLDPTRSMTLGSSLSNRCAVLVYSSTDNILARATATNKFNSQTEGLTGEYVKSGTVMSVSWIQYVAGEDAEGGYIIFQLRPASASTNAFPFIMEVGYDEGAQAEDIALTPAEYAYDPRKNV